MAHLKLDMPPEAWRTLLPFLHHHATHVEASPLNHDPQRVISHLEEAIREQFTED